MINMNVLDYTWLTRAAATAPRCSFHDRGALYIMTFLLGIHSLEHGLEPCFSSESVDNGETPSFKLTLS